MTLKEIRCLSYDERCQWLISPDGLDVLRTWLREGMSLRKIAFRLWVTDKTLYQWRKRYPVLQDTIKSYATQEVMDTGKYRPPAYRVLLGYDSNTPQCIIAEEYDTAEEAWQSDLVRKFYLSACHCSPEPYISHYLQRLRSKGYCKLSNLLCIAYCSVTCEGSVIIRPTPK